MNARDWLGIAGFAMTVTYAAAARSEVTVGVEVGGGAGGVRGHETGESTRLGGELLGPIFRTGAVVDVREWFCGCIAVGISTGVIGSVYSLERQRELSEVRSVESFHMQTVSIPLFLSLAFLQRSPVRLRVDAGLEFVIPTDASGEAVDTLVAPQPPENAKELTLKLEGTESTHFLPAVRLAAEIWPTRDLGIVLGARGAYGGYGPDEGDPRVDVNGLVDLRAEWELTGFLNLVHRFGGPTPRELEPRTSPSREAP